GVGMTSIAALAPSPLAPFRSSSLRLASGSGSRVLADLEDARATELMARFRDTRALEDFERLYAETRLSVLNWIRSLLRQGNARLDAHELLQDTFVNVFRYPSSFRDEAPSSFRVWVRTIAGNVVRRARSRLPREATFELPEGSIEPASSAVGPALQADMSEAAAHLGRAFTLLLVCYVEAYGQLSPRDRRALELVEVDGLPYVDAAEALGVRPSNMKMIVFRARRRLNQRLAQRLSCGVA
ncbi:MAG: RNA polymerase sigma factor, partial [Planctomycetota bacterium]